jgi:hypothetical protein
MDREARDSSGMLMCLMRCLRHILDLKILCRRKGSQCCYSLEDEIQVENTSGDQGCTSKTHAVSITQVMWIALHAVSHFQPWLICNSTSSCPFLDHLLQTKKNESWKKLSRISERVHKQKMPSKIHGHFSRASACCSRRGEGRRLLNGRYYGITSKKSNSLGQPKCRWRKEALGPWRQWSG